ncbi:MAG: 50S ribosomal protein L6 [Rickettsiales bacterium]
MSRLGKRIIPIPVGVTLKCEETRIVVSKGNNVLEKNILQGVSVSNENNGVLVTPLRDDIFCRAMWGTCRSIIFNMIKGVTDGFQTSIEIVGVGYKAEVLDKLLILSLGYSHDIFLTIPKNIELTCEKPTLMHIKSSDKEALGQFVALIQSLRKKDPYKGKGIYKVGEYRRRKKGKNK